ncbi:MAG: metallophosphoesterase [Pseudomonadota bacterium]
MTTIAHLSDVHLAPLPWPGITQMFNQRVLGFLNWHVFGRKEHHRRDMLEVLVADLKQRSFDHLAITGDIVNIALPQEFAQAVPWLAQLGRPEDLSIVPGNHDAYTAISMRKGIGTWTPYMRSTAAGAAYARSLTTEPYTGFPFVRLVGDVALVGLASGIPTRPFAAYGTLGSAQRAAFEDTLIALSGTGRAIVVLIHHPPLPGLAAPMRDLTDGEEFAAILSRREVHLVLHGHNHRNELAYGAGPHGAYPVVGIASASMAVPTHAPLAQYNCYDFARGADGWEITMREFAAQAPGGAIKALPPRLLAPADASAAPAEATAGASDLAVGGKAA